MNKYNPNSDNRKGLPQRRSIRLKGYDYSQAGLYFITICCQDRICRFGEIKNGEMILNEYGEIAYNEWIKLTERFTNFELDVFQIMPNHMHGIIVLNDDVGATLAVAPNSFDSSNELVAQNEIDKSNEIDSSISFDSIGAGASPAPTVFDIVGAYKSLVANGCLKIWKLQWTGVNPAPNMGKLWQRNYYEHIIRNEESYQNISAYIINNPAKWKDDKFYK